MVSYTGPVFEELQHGQGKVSEREEVMDAFDEHDEVEGIDEAGTSCGKRGYRLCFMAREVNKGKGK